MVGGNRSAPWLDRSRWVLVVGVPVAVVVMAGWQRRWLCDDAFINLRVLRQIGAGHGPVFNQGERVEVATSPLWLALVGVVGALTRIRLEWVAVGLGLLCTATAMAVGALGARRLHRPAHGTDGPSDRERWWLPVGLAAFAAIPVVWDYATGGLENGLSWLWWATTFALAVRATVTGPPEREDEHGDGERSASRRSSTRRAAAVAAGLGPLVRPDLAIVSAVFVTLLVLDAAATPHGPDGRAPSAALIRRGLAVAAWAAVVPGLFQFFRMGYYGQLLPNTVYAKEGSRAWWSQGATYLGDLTTSYALWAGALAVGFVTVGAFRGTPQVTGRRRLVITALVAAALHGTLVVRAGGDYMHGRLLLPSLFGLLLPVAAVPVPATATARRWVVAGCMAGGMWVLVATGLLGGTGQPDHPTGIHDERRTTVTSAGTAHPVTVESHVAYLEDAGIDLRTWGEGKPPTWHPSIYAPPALRRPAGTSPAVTFGAMGAVPYRLPIDVHVADQLGLADAVTAHVRLERRSIPGHEKYLGMAWWAPRLLPDDVVVPPGIDRAPILVVDPNPIPSDDPAEIARRRDDATAALACGDLGSLRDASTAPLTVGRFLRNVAGAPTLHAFRFDRDPTTARAKLCG